MLASSDGAVHALSGASGAGVPAVLEGKSLAAKMYTQIAMKLAGMEVNEKESVGFFTRLGRALGLTPNPA